jgi:uncharacterized protein (DUF58 family)
MYRLAYLVYRLATSLMGWARRHFTTAGFVVLGGLAISAISGFDTEKSLTHQLFTFLASALGLSLLCSMWFRFRFGARRELPRFGSVGLPMPYRILVRNDSGRMQRGLEVRDELADNRPGFAEFVLIMKARDRRTGSFRIKRPPKRPSRAVAAVKAAPLPDLLPGAEAEVSVELLPLRRGVVRFTGVTVGRPDPLGLFKALAHQSLGANVLVLPKRYFLPAIALPGSMKYQQGGVALAASIGQSDEFVSLREYRAGDPVRHIHWKSWAKTGKPVVKEFEDEFFVRHALVLDTFTDEPDSQLFEEAVSVAASFACTVRTQESLLDLLFVGAEAYCFTAGRGLGHTEQLLEVLAAVRVCPDRVFKDLSNLVLNHAGLVSGCIVILLTWDQGRKEMVERLRTLGVPILVLVLADAGATGPLQAALQRDQQAGARILEVGKVEEGLSQI